MNIEMIDIPLWGILIYSIHLDSEKITLAWANDKGNVGKTFTEEELIKFLEENIGEIKEE